MQSNSPIRIKSQSPFFQLGDLLVLAIVLAAGIKTLPWLWTGTGHTAVIRVDGQKQMRIQLEGKPRRGQVVGTLGTVEFEWGQDGVHILKAPCPHQLCLKSGWIKRRGHRLICVPSHLEIAVEGEEEPNPIDAITF